MRKAVVIILVVFVMVLLGLDRLGQVVADGQIASRVQKSQGLASHPDVSIKGFPFLTQVLGGRYKEVDVTVQNVTRNGLTVDRVSVRAHGVSVPLGQVLSGSVREVPVQRADAQVVLGFAHLNGYLSQQLGQALRVNSVDNRLSLTGTLPFPPRIKLTTAASVDVTGDSITLRPTAVDTLLSRIPRSGLARGLVQRFFTVRLPISQLPFGIRLQRATVTADAVVIAASATGLTLRAPSS